jgi:hypothetical protein
MKRLMVGIAVALSFVGLMVFARRDHRGGGFLGFGSGYSRPYYDPYYGDPLYSGGYDPYYRQSKGGRIASSILGAAAGITDAATSRRRHYRDDYYY